MSQFEDPSIISMVTSSGTEQSSDQYSIKDTVSNLADNAITKFLRDAESKRVEEDKSEDSTSVSNTPTNQQPPKEKDLLNDVKNREFIIEDWDFEFTKNDIKRYFPSELLEIRKNKESLVVPGELPPKSYYRLRNKLPSTQRKDFNGYNSRNYADGTGSMGNFSLNNRRNHHDKSYNNRFNNGNNNRRNNRHNKRNDEDSWIADFEKDGPAGNADDFEKWRNDVKNEKRKKRGEEFTEVINEAPKNTIDSFFGLSKNKQHSSATSVTTPDVGKNSKFFSFFQPETQSSSTDLNSQAQNNNDSGDKVSKVLSFLDNNENNEQRQASNVSITSSPQVNNPSQQQRSQFSFGASSPSSVQSQPQPQKQQSQQQQQAILPPGLVQDPQRKGGSDSFFMSLLNRDAEIEERASNESKKQTTKEVPQEIKSNSPQSQIVPPVQKQQTTQQQKPQPQRVPSQQQLPPGLQPPLQRQSSQPQQSQQQQQQPQQQQQQGGLYAGQLPPPGFQGLPPPPPGFQPQNLPPWLSQQYPPFTPDGRFLPQPHQLPPPHLRQQLQGQQLQGQQLQGQQQVPPQFMYPPNGFPPQGSSNNGGRFPPGFFNGPPPLGFQPQHVQQQQQQQQQHQEK